MHIIALYGIGFVKLFAKIANFELLDPLFDETYKKTYDRLAFVILPCEWLPIVGDSRFHFLNITY